MLRSRSTLVRESHLTRKTGGLQSLPRSGKEFPARGVRGGNLVPADETVDRLLKGLLMLARTVEEVLEIRAVRAGVGRHLGTTSVQVLRLLSHRDSHTASQLARFLGVSKPRVSQMIDTMERDGLVVRQRAKHDQREVLLKLTQRGRMTARAVQREQRQRLRIALKPARKESALRWADTLHEITAAIAKAERVFDHFCLQCEAHADGTCVLTGGDAECLYLRHAAKPSDGPSQESPKTRRRKPVP
jgi:DNA-binding MarR family transcriptional regulator